MNPDFTKIRRGETIAVALSGGEDSVCLLDVLLKNKDALGISVVAVNVEHGIRGENSLRDTAFCVRLCKDLGVTLYRFSVDAPALALKNGYSLEQAARILRYEKLLYCVTEGLCDKVAVAHHLSDQAETVLFNILRGSSLSGARGMTPLSYGGRIVRPFLNVTKAEIDKYAKENDIHFVTDETNFDVTFTRNALRLEVLPKVKKIFPSYERALGRFATTCLSDDEYLYSLAEKQVTADGEDYLISSDSEYPVFSRAVIVAIKRLGVEKDFTKTQVDRVFALCSAQTGKRIVINKTVFAIKEHNAVRIKRKNAENRPIDGLFAKSDFAFAQGESEKTIVFDGAKITARKVLRSGIRFGDGLYFDADKVPVSAVFRYKRDGDVFQKFNGQTVTVKKFLTDKKVPADKKRKTIVLADEKNVFIIVGTEISSLIKIDKGTENIVKLTCMETSGK